MVPWEKVRSFDEEEIAIDVEDLEEIGPNMQMEIISSLKKEKVAELIDKMTPGQAADVLSVLPFQDQRVIMNLMDERKGEASNMFSRYDFRALPVVDNHFLD